MHQIMLINVTGPDRPGLTAGLTQRLAEDGVDVLDMGQSVIHDYLTLGILVRFPLAQQTDMATLGEWLSTEGFAVALNPISDAEYEEWVTKQGQPRTILTILGRSITADQLAVLAEGVAAEGLNIISYSMTSAPSKLSPDLKVLSHTRPVFRFFNRTRLNA